MNRHFRVALVAAAAWAASGPAEAQSARVYTPRDFQYQTDDPNSARLGIFLGDDNGLRDTLGVLVNSVVEDGPAAKAGIKEGDRIQSIGGVNLKMTRDDASDDALSGMMARRLVRELDKLKAGDDVELKVYSGGTTRSARVKTVASRELATAPK
jgi:S1-C subfamily serine protease